MKSLEQQLEFVELQEEYLKDEMRHLQRELLRAKEEIRRIQSVPLVIGQFNEMIDANYGIVSSTAGSNYYVRILSTLDRNCSSQTHPLPFIVIRIPLSMSCHRNPIQPSNS
jgi:26S proteasome regulatory subunit T3